jgi:hypothetical protein
VRLGILLPGTGPLAAAAAVQTTARAADELGYASLWSTSADVLQIAARTAPVPRGLLLAQAPTDLHVDGLTYLAGPALDRRAGERCTPVPRVLESGPAAPEAGAVDGWCPRDDGALAVASWSGLLVVRLHRVPDGAWLQRLAAAGAAEVLVHLPGASLDGQLAGFAEAAEAVAALGIPAQGGPRSAPTLSSSALLPGA